MLWYFVGPNARQTMPQSQQMQWCNCVQCTTVSQERGIFKMLFHKLLPVALILVWAFFSQHAERGAYFLNKQSTLTFVPGKTFLMSELVISPGQGSTRPPKVSPTCLVPEQSPHQLAMAGLRQWQDITVAPWRSPRVLTGNFWHLRHWGKKTLFWLSPPAPHCIWVPFRGYREVICAFQGLAQGSLAAQHPTVSFGFCYPVLTS